MKEKSAQHPKRFKEKNNKRRRWNKKKRFSWSVRAFCILRSFNERVKMEKRKEKKKEGRNQRKRRKTKERREIIT
jgi:hypothetical protein